MPGQDQSYCHAAQFFCSKSEFFSTLVSVPEVFAKVSTDREHLDDKERKIRQITEGYVNVFMYSSLAKALNNHFVRRIRPLSYGSFQGKIEYQKKSCAAICVGPMASACRSGQHRFSCPAIIFAL